MRDKIKEIRNEILIEAWNNHKTNWDMSEIAEAMKINIKSAYRIIKENRERKIIIK